MRFHILTSVILSFSVPVFASSYVSVLKCGADSNRFELFLDKEDSSNALYSFGAPELRSLSEVQTRKLNLVNDSGQESTRIALSYSKAEESLIYNDITKKLDLKLNGQNVSMECTLTANNENQPILYKLNKL